MQFSVNMLTFNGEEFIEKTLRSVLPFTSEALVIDTGSTDKTFGILKNLQKEYPQLLIEYKDIQYLGETWSNSPKDVELTKLLNIMKSVTKGEWILKIDDDEEYPKELMGEILSLKPVYPIYSLPFKHIGGKNKKWLIKRLFQNIPIVAWEGIYGVETLCIRGKRVSSKNCPSLSNHFLHYGGLRTNNDRKHDYSQY